MRRTWRLNHLTAEPPTRQHTQDVHIMVKHVINIHFIDFQYLVSDHPILLLLSLQSWIMVFF